MTILDAGVVIVACVAIWAAATLAEKVCWVLVVRRHKHDGLSDVRVLRPLKQRLTRKPRLIDGQDPADGY